MSRHPLRFRWLPIALAAVLVVAGCGNSNATGTPQPTSTLAKTVEQSTATPKTSASTKPGATATAAQEAATYAEIEKAVESIRGLDLKTPLTPTLLNEQAVRDYMTKSFDEDTAPAVLAITEKEYKHLGLLPADASLKQLEIDIQSSQVIGFYDPKSKGLYLVSTDGRVGALQKATFSHEFTHALQDQNFDMTKYLPGSSDQSDRDTARLAVVEGDATLAMTYWAQKALSILDLGELAGAASGPQQEQLDNAPRVLRESLMFPYMQGLSFVQHVYSNGGWKAVNRLYTSPPASTSQILHPDLYDQHVAPVAVSLPKPPSGFSLVNADTAGEFLLGLWLGEGKTTDEQSAAATTVAGWAGDRFGLYESGDGKWAIVISTAWRNATSRTAFAASAGTAAHGAGSAIQACTVGTNVNVVIASDAATLGRFNCGR